MNMEFIARVARANWHILLVTVCILGVAAYQANSAPPKPGILSASVTTAHGNAKAAPIEAAPILDAVTAEKTSRREMAMAAIRENEAALGSSADPLNAAAYMNGIANLYFQRLQDYDSAAGYYERVLSEHPDAPCAYQTYVQLALCYERLNQPEKRTATLRRMLARFPEDSQEYAYAYSELYGALPNDQPIAADSPKTGPASLELAQALPSGH
ncbi:MAG: tetratricopeptide repeat protein [Candidatus Hydrogenedentes bacterium]|nr:tetratricopeptide repeat protein [Candidatus Hydrogenedentota bacterium]